MNKHEQAQRKLQEIERLAHGWGKLLAGAAFPDGVGLDVDFVTMEAFAATAAKALVQGAIETMTQDQAEEVGEEAACPQCGKLCRVEHRVRPLTVRGAATPEVTEPRGYCSTCRRAFFPSARSAENRRSPVQSDGG
jgi:hypothetical protein